MNEEIILSQIDLSPAFEIRTYPETPSSYTIANGITFMANTVNEL
jgi:hypothetical protein